MDQTFSPSAGQDERNRTTANMNARNYHAQHIASPSFPRPDYQRPSMSTINAPLEYQGLSGSGGTSVHPGNRTSLTARPLPGSDSLNHQEPVNRYDEDVVHSVEYPGISASDTRNGFHVTSSNQPKQLLPAHSPKDRHLPPRELTDQTLDDAYVAFVLYCNPAVPMSTDSTELRKVFRTPPKSDGKSFSTFKLFELIRKLEDKEIRTWTQLAIQLGVEPPSTEKNQSAQKVQQYAVRLKRWMRAMHVDAFFEYCLSKPHAYYMQVPPQHEPFSEEGRDGVLMEEDLALRALLPEWRPKRGRRKAEERDNDYQTTVSAAKRPHLDTSMPMTDFDDFDGHHSALFTPSAVPWSAHPADSGPHDSWAPFSAITPSTLSTVQANTPHPNTAHPGGQHFRWRLNARETTPSTPYPQSAVTPRNGHPAGSSFDEPQSAITLSSTGSKARPRRRHGPAVSSAWSSGGNAATGKLRGRPPSNRSVRDGPFSTFPANPNTKEGPTINLGGSTPASTPVAGKGESPRFEQHSPRQSPRSVHQHQPLQARPSRLQLQVPQHSGGPVRLATPPTLLVNGEYGHPAPLALNRHERRSSADFFDHVEDDEDVSEDMSWRPEGQLHEANPVPGFNLKGIAQAFASSLRNADVDGGEPLTTDDARRLSEKVIDQLRLKQGVTQQIPLDKMLEHYALILGVNETMGLGVWPPSTEKQVFVKRATSTRYADGWTQGAYEGSEPESQNAHKERHRHKGIKVYEIKWKVMYGDLMGDFHFKDLRPDEPSWVPPPAVEGPTYNDGPPQDRRRSQGVDGTTDGADGDVDWKRRYLDLQKKLKEKEEDLQGLRRRVLEVVF